MAQVKLTKTQKLQLQAVHRTVMRRLVEVSRNDLEKFVIQQNYIQYFLIQIIILRSGFLDNKFVENLERATLGTLISYFKVCCLKNNKELVLVGSLDKYNSVRNYLTHKLLNDTSGTKFEVEVKRANETGISIINDLEILLQNKLKSRAIHKALLELAAKGEIR